MANNQTDTDLEVLNQSDATNKEPESNSIKIRKPFDIAGKTRILYDIATNGKAPRTFGWRIHEGSEVIVYGSNLDIFNQINLFISGSVFSITQVESSSDGRTLSFNIPEEIANLFEDGTVIELAFVDSRNYENNRFLEEKFRYFHKDDTKEEQEAKQKQTEQEKVSNINNQPNFVSEVINQTIGAPVTGFASGLKGSQPTIQQKPLAKKSDNNLTSKKLRKNEADDDNLAGGFETDTQVEEIEKKTVSAKVENSTQAIELVGEYIEKNPEVIVNSKVRSEVLNSLSSNQVEQMSGEAKLALNNVLKLNVQATPGQNIEQTAQAFKIVAQIPELSSVSEANFTTTAQVEVLGKTQENNQPETPVVNNSGPVSNEKLVNVSNSSQISLSQAGEIVGQELSKNTSLIPNSNVRKEVLLALQSGNLNSLSSEAKAGLSFALSNIGQNPSNANTVKAITAINQELLPEDKNESDVNKVPELPKKVDEQNNQKPKKQLPEDKNSQPVNENKTKSEPSAGAKLLDNLKAKDKQIKQKILGGNLPGNKNLPNLANKPIKQDLSLGGPENLTGGGNLNTKPNNTEPESLEDANNITQGGGKDKKDEAFEKDDLTESKEQELPEQLNAQNLNAENNVGEEREEREEMGEREQGEEREEREEEEETDEENEDSLEQDQQNLEPQLNQAQNKLPGVGSKALEAEINLVVTEANIAVNTYLMGLVVAAWTSIFGIPLGAIFGDVLLLSESVLKAIVKKQIQFLLRTEALQKEADSIVDRIKISWAVKANILLMNLVTAIAIGIILIGVLVFLKVICSPVKIISGLPEISGIQSVCNAVNNIPGGNLSEYVNTPASGTIR